MGLCYRPEPSAQSRLGQAVGGGHSRRADYLGRGSPPSTHHLLLYPRALAWDCGGGERTAFLSQSAEGIPLGAPLAADRRGRETDSVGAQGSQGVSVDRWLTLSLSWAYGFA